MSTKKKNKKGGKGGEKDLKKEKKKKLMSYKQLSTQAVMDFQNSRFRDSANHYMEAFQALGDSDQYESTRWQNFKGYTSILREKFFSPTQSDMDFLISVSEDKAELRLFRSESAFTVGLLNWDVKKREDAAVYYREAIRLAEKCKPGELKMKFMATKRSANGGMFLESTAVKDLIAEVIEVTRGNLEIIQDPLNKALPEKQRSHYRSDGSKLAPDIRTSESRYAGITTEQLEWLIGTGGDKCDHCHKTPKEANLTHLLQCSNCKKAFYCSKECATKQWKAGHKSACRKQGIFKSGDFVRLQDFVNAAQYNGRIVRLVGPAPQPGRWAVRPDGDYPGGKTISVAAQKLEQLRPLI